MEQLIDDMPEWDPKKGKEIIDALAQTAKYSKILMDLVTLRETDYDAFMERLYEALTGEFRNAIYDGAPAEEKCKALNTMLEYFKEEDAFEKCAQIQKLIKEIESSQVPTGIVNTLNYKK